MFSNLLFYRLQRVWSWPVRKFYWVFFLSLFLFSSHLILSGSLLYFTGESYMTVSFPNIKAFSVFKVFLFVFIYFLLNCSWFVGFCRFEFSQCDIWYMRFCLDFEQRVRISDLCMPKGRCCPSFPWAVGMYKTWWQNTCMLFVILWMAQNEVNEITLYSQLDTITTRSTWKLQTEYWIS